MKKSFQIFVNTLAEGSITIEVLEDETIRSLKEKIEDKEGLIKVNIHYLRIIYYIGIPLNHQKLIFEEEELADNKTMQDYNIVKDKIVIVEQSFPIFVSPFVSPFVGIIEVFADESIKSLKEKIKDKGGLIKVNIYFIQE
jgi:hypothetical protein